ncbi:MAG TPA: SDR family NAD(P)-dependent oxidoreductase [Bacilli bacterium]|nr:SDR family NAD(P)-dependent oxidoreductase [Bacilli bacterium]
MKRINRYIRDNLADLEGKKVIVTGANSGIGFSICDVLLFKDAHIVMACRNMQRAEEARDLLMQRHPNAFIDIVMFDQSSLSSIDHFVQLLKNEHNDFYALILNAGVFSPKKSSTFENYVPLTIGTNFLGPLYLLSLIQDFLTTVKTEKRIILQGSLAYHFVHYKNKNLSLLNGKQSLMKQYFISKLGISQVFSFYSSSNTNPYVKYLLAEPGISNTQIIRNYKKWFKIIANGFLSVFLHSNVKASLSACHLACQIVANGDYYRPRGLWSVSGYPHLSHFKKKRVDYRIIIDGLDVLGSLYAK